MTILGFTVWEVLGVLSIMCMIAVLIVMFIWLLNYRKICNTIIRELKKPKITKPK